MSDTNAEHKKNICKLNGLYAFKEGMSTIFNEAGEAVPVTVLRYESMTVSQIKTVDKDGYSALQLACGVKSSDQFNKAEQGHLQKAGIKSLPKYVREIRQEVPSGIELGVVVDISSLSKGDIVTVTSVSKGHGFAGAVKRWSLAGGPASHGSKFHRRPGSSGNRTWPGRVMPGKKFPGHWGNEVITVKNIEVVDVIPEHSVLLLRGPVPGARNTLVKLLRA